MTTIVYHAGTIAWDSRISDSNGGIITDTGQKMLRVGKRLFWCAGTVGDFQEFCELYPKRKSKRELSCSAFVLEADGTLQLVSTEGHEVWRTPVTCSRAIGSGADHAITAIDCGKSPADAVRMAAKRDKSTGGKIRVRVL